MKSSGEQKLARKFKNPCLITLDSITKENGVIIFHDLGRHTPVGVVANHLSEHEGTLLLAARPEYIFAYINGVHLIPTLDAFPGTQSKGEIYFIRLSEIPEPTLSNIFVTKNDSDTLLSTDQLKGKTLAENIFKAQKTVIPYQRYIIPTPFHKRVSEIKPKKPVSVGFFDHTVLCHIGVTPNQVSNIPSQISALYMEYCNEDKKDEQKSFVSDNYLQQLMQAIPTHITALILKGQVKFEKIAPHLPKHLREIRLSDGFKITNAKNFVHKIPPQITQIGIDANTESIKNVLNEFSKPDCSSPITAIRLHYGSYKADTASKIIKCIPEHFTTIYLSSDIDVSKGQIGYILSYIKPGNRRHLTIGYPLTLTETSYFESPPNNLRNSTINFYPYVGPEHSPGILSDLPTDNLLSSIILMPGVKPETVKALETFENIHFRIILYPGLSSEIMSCLPKNSRDFTLCLPGKSDENKMVLSLIPKKYIYKLTFAYGCDKDTASAIPSQCFSDGITLSIDQGTNSDIISRFFQYTKEKKITIESIEIPHKNINTACLKKIPKNIAETALIHLCSLSKNIISRLPKQINHIVFPMMAHMELQKRENFSSLKFFTELYEIEFYTKINTQVLQSIAAIPSVKIIGLYFKINSDPTRFANAISRFSSDTKRRIKQLVFSRDNEKFCQQVIDKLKKDKPLAFDIYVDDKQLYNAKKRKHSELKSSKSIAPPRKKRKLNEKTSASPLLFKFPKNNATDSQLDEGTINFLELN